MLHIYRKMYTKRQSVFGMEDSRAIELAAMASICSDTTQKWVAEHNDILMGFFDGDPIEVFPYLEKVLRLHPDGWFRISELNTFFTQGRSVEEFTDLLDLVDNMNSSVDTLLRLDLPEYSWDSLRTWFLNRNQKFYNYSLLPPRWWQPDIEEENVGRIKNQIEDAILLKEWYGFYSSGSSSVDDYLVDQGISPKMGNALLDFIKWTDTAYLEGHLVPFFRTFGLKSRELLEVHPEQKDSIIKAFTSARYWKTDLLEVALRNFPSFYGDSFANLIEIWDSVIVDRDYTLEELVSMATDVSDDDTAEKRCYLKGKDLANAFPVDVEFKASHYVGKFLKRADPNGIRLGYLTNCCQHFGDAGQSCAIHGQTSKYGGFFAIYDGKKIIAQSWVWIGYGTANLGGVCFDNIECLGGLKNRQESILSIYKDAAEFLIGKELSEIPIAKVTVGTGHDDAGVNILPSSKPLKFFDYNGYTDADHQRLLAKVSSDDGNYYPDEWLDDEEEVFDPFEDDWESVPEDWDPFADDNDMEPIIDADDTDWDDFRAIDADGNIYDTRDLEGLEI